jgi:transcriptional accessory protein Tex/SPT6
MTIVQPFLDSLSSEEKKEVKDLFTRYNSWAQPIRQRKEEEDRKEREEARRKESEEAKKMELRSNLSKFIDLLIAGRISKEEALDTLEKHLIDRIPTKPSYYPFQYTK